MKIGKEKKKSVIFQIISEENRGNLLFPINERDEENSEINIVEGSINKKEGGNYVFYLTENIHLINIKIVKVLIKIPIKILIKIPKII